MRKSKEEAAETRRRIVKAAACEFREKGTVATGLAVLMKAAGMTHGGFEKLFDSKDQLVAGACEQTVEGAIGGMEAQPTLDAAVAGFPSIEQTVLDIAAAADRTGASPSGGKARSRAKGTGGRRAARPAPEDPGDREDG